MTDWLLDMEAAEGFLAKVSVFEGMDVSDVNTGSQYEDVEFVSGVGKGMEELCEIQGEEVIQS